MRTIILAAGQGYKLGNFNKLLLNNPKTKLTILETYLEIFSGTDVCIVVGYKAVNIINRYPHIKYIYNPDWHITKDSYSLGLALNDEPCYVIHSDMFISLDVRDNLDSSMDNCAITINHDGRTSSALNCVIDENRIERIYQGELFNQSDPELLGIFKVTDKEALQYWKKSCLEHKNLLIGQNYPLNKKIPLYQVNGNKMSITIIKNIYDYTKFLNDQQIIT